MKKILVILLSLTFLLACSQKKDNTPAPGPGPDMTPPAMQPEPEMAPEPAMTPEPAMAPDPKTATPPVAPGALLEIPPDATVVETPLWHQTFTLEGKKYIALNSSRYKESKDLKGYTAPIELAAIFDEAGTIVRVMVVTHKETPEFMERIVKEWLPKLADLKKDKPIVGEGGIDALSEATVSTTAMTKTIDEMRKLAFTQILKIELPATPATPAAEDMAAPAADDMAAAPADMK